jgi:hypothetical protein
MAQGGWIVPKISNLSTFLMVKNKVSLLQRLRTSNTLYVRGKRISWNHITYSVCLLCTRCMLYIMRKKLTQPSVGIELTTSRIRDQHPQLELHGAALFTSIPLPGFESWWRQNFLKIFLRGLCGLGRSVGVIVSQCRLS